MVLKRRSDTEFLRRQSTVHLSLKNRASLKSDINRQTLSIKLDK